MKVLVFITSLVFFNTFSFSQSKKEVKAHKIKGSMTTIIENGKTINEGKTLFDSKGKEIEKTDYTKEGVLKSIHKIKYNSDGDEIEDEEFDPANKLVEKKYTKYNLLGEKTEESFFDGAGNDTKKHTYTYDSKGLKTERKTLDPEGKVISIKKHVYITK